MYPGKNSHMAAIRLFTPKLAIWRQPVRDRVEITLLATDTWVLVSSLDGAVYTQM